MSPPGSCSPFGVSIFPPVTAAASPSLLPRGAEISARSPLLPLDFSRCPGESFSDPCNAEFLSPRKGRKGMAGESLSKRIEELLSSAVGPDSPATAVAGGSRRHRELHVTGPSGLPVSRLSAPAVWSTLDGCALFHAGEVAHVLLAFTSGGTRAGGQRVAPLLLASVPEALPSRAASKAATTTISFPY